MAASVRSTVVPSCQNRLGSEVRSKTVQVVRGGCSTVRMTRDGCIDSFVIPLDIGSPPFICCDCKHCLTLKRF